MSGNGTRPWVIGGALAGAVLVGLTWLLVVGPTRSEAQGLRDDTASVRSQNDVLMSRASTLRTEAQGRSTLEADVRDALASLPADVALPGFNQELTEHAAARGVQIVSVSVGAAVAPAASGAAEVQQGGILSVPITIQTKGARLAQLYFLRDLQEVGPRAALVSSTSLTADGDDGGSATDVTDTTDDSTATTMTTQLSIFSHALSAADAEDLAAVVDTPSTD